MSIILYKGQHVPKKWCKPQSMRKLLEEKDRIMNLPDTEFNRRRLIACERTLLRKFKSYKPEIDRILWENLLPSERSTIPWGNRKKRITQ